MERASRNNGDGVNSGRYLPVSGDLQSATDEDFEGAGEDSPLLSAVSEEGESRPWYRWVFSYASYVLLLMLLTYLLNQLDRYMLAITSKSLAHDMHFGDQACMVNASLSAAQIKGAVCNATTQASCQATTSPEGFTACTWDYNGQGLEYQLLAGPVFILIYTFAGIPVSFTADMYNRKNFLALSLIFWSVMTILTGLVKEYWQLVVLRFLLGLGEAGCTPFAVSVLTDYFPQKHRGTVVGIYNLGIYSGYSLSYALGNFITLANINNQGWRWSFFISGIPGVIIGFLILTTVREPQRRQAAKPSTTLNPAGDASQTEKDVATMSACYKLKRTCKPFATASVLLLCLGGSIRNAAGYVWAYNTQPYFEAAGQTPTQIGSYMSWVPLVGGSIGVILGGMISDRLVKRLGLVARVIVLTSSQLVAAPFAAATLFFAAPVSYIMQIPTYIIGEMWVGVALAVLVELVDSEFKTSAIAVYLFIITNIGGNIPLLVPPIQKAFEQAGYVSTQALRDALYILYPGLYIGGGLLFLLTVCSLRRDKQRLEYQRMAEREGGGSVKHD